MKREELVNLAKKIDVCHKWGDNVVTEDIYFCKAKLVRNSNYNDFIVVRSYRTDVALFDIVSGIMYVFGYYSSTTVQHICKAMILLSQQGYNVNDKVNLYVTSRISAKKGNLLINEDFESLIQLHNI